MTDLEGRRVLITGATGGLGAAVTRAFSAARAQVIASARGTTPESLPDETFFIHADLTDSNEVDRLFQQLSGSFRQLDAVIHLAGGFAPGLPTQTAVDDWDRMMNINLRSAFLVFRAASAILNPVSGRLLTIGSTAAQTLPASAAAYAVSKAGLHALIQLLAKDGEKRGFTANAIVPGTIDTPANRAAMPGADPSGWTKPETIARQLLYLASESSAAVNGRLIDPNEPLQSVVA